MLLVEKFISMLAVDFFVGVPDSKLKPLVNYLMDKYGVDNKHHLIAANEGNCVAIAAGYYLATGKIPLVYLQNSGEGNVINPIASLISPDVYNIPVIFVIGWRGEDGIKDEPQHKFQGKITKDLIDLMQIKNVTLTENTTEETLKEDLKELKKELEEGRSIAFLVKEKALKFEKNIEYKNNNKLKREEIIEKIVEFANEDIMVSTTGKASRELFEIRENKNMSHNNDFLTVGSMGHSSSIALGIAISNEKEKIWCIDGDGAAIMHLGALPVIGEVKPSNLIHVLINNGAHESVGGMPTVAQNGCEFSKIAKACGYEYIYKVKTMWELEEALLQTKKNKGLTFIEVMSAIGARSDLKRPTLTPIENKQNFMNRLRRKGV
ncbi:phosphonopyruvate decarboxylase [Lachnobacterium bovis]|uniref:phosphonopyruvate decarboxylase n=1 Tax=Lachnobacterium bovis TaxID=140626 RepID=UPI000554441A|nr:phosphonopyruvate decarboxylase [Lachnobacterium bovis]